MTPAQLQTLSTELKADPLGRGYTTLDDESAAANVSRPDRSVAREEISGGLIASCLTRAEYVALAADDKDYVRLLCSTAAPIPLSSALRTQLAAIFPANSATRANIQKAVNRSGTRAEELNIPTPTTSDVATARRLP